MKQTIKRITSCAVIATALLATPAISFAKDASTNSPVASAEVGGPNKFYGPVTKVDTNKMTFTVGEQTFKIIAESQVTDKEDKKATIADAVVGQPARGSYTKKSDGTLNVTKVRFGKKMGGKAGGRGAGAKAGGKTGGKKKAGGAAPAAAE